MRHLRWQHRNPILHRRGTAEEPDEPPQTKSRLKPVILWLLLLILLLTGLTLILLEWRLQPVLSDWAELQAVNLATEAINLAVMETLPLGVQTAKTADLITDDQGRLQAVQYDMTAIHRFTTETSQHILQSLRQLEKEILAIPLGQLSGLAFLAARGPGIPVQILPAGAVTTSPIGSFVSAGINQTWHRVYLDIRVTIRIIAPLAKSDQLVQMRVPIIEEIFIGDVPTWFFVADSQTPFLQGYPFLDDTLEFPIGKPQL